MRDTSAAVFLRFLSLPVGRFLSCQFGSPSDQICSSQDLSFTPFLPPFGESFMRTAPSLLLLPVKEGIDFDPIYLSQLLLSHG